MQPCLLRSVCCRNKHDVAALVCGSNASGACGCSKCRAPQTRLPTLHSAS